MNATDVQCDALKYIYLHRQTKVQNDMKRYDEEVNNEKHFLRNIFTF